MSKSLEILDLFCGAGGCSVGYARACDKLGIAYNITGVDNQDMPDYPFNFIKADYKKYCTKKNLQKFDIIHASPVCKGYSRTMHIHKSSGIKHPLQIPEVIEILNKSGKSWILENVSKKAVRPDLTLTGQMFGLKVIRKRFFQLSDDLLLINHSEVKPIGTVRNGDLCSVFGRGSYRKSKYDAIPKFKKATVRETWSYAMGIDWMSKDVYISQAIPPAYTEFIGLQIFESIYNLKNLKQ